MSHSVFTCVVEQSGDEGAVSEEGVRGGDVLKVALLKHRVLEHHGLHLQIEEPGGNGHNLVAIKTHQTDEQLKEKSEGGNFSLDVEVVSFTVHLVFQGEVKRDVVHSLLGEGLCARLVFLFLDVLDHVWEPHRQAVVAARFFHRA